MLEENVLYSMIYEQVNPFERNNSHTNIKHLTPYNSPLHKITLVCANSLSVTLVNINTIKNK